MFHLSRAEQSKAEAVGGKGSEKREEGGKKKKRLHEKDAEQRSDRRRRRRRQQPGSTQPELPLLSLFSLASVPLINSWLSSVTNVSLPSSSPGEEGGVFNVQFVLWIDVCWHRLSPSAAPCVIYCTITKRASFLLFFFLFYAHSTSRILSSGGRRKKKREKLPAGLTD